MFPVLGLLQNLECNKKSTCNNGVCVFSHSIVQRPPPPKPSSKPQTALPTALAPKKPPKRPSDPVPQPAPKKRVIKSEPSLPQTLSDGTPRIHASAAHSKIPVGDRQRSLSALYEQFYKMYAKLDDRKTCAFRDAREQETEIYESTQTNTYKSATANTLIKLKRRAPITDSTSPVIGTENTIRKRLEEAERSQSTTLTRSNLKKYIPTPAQLQEYGYVVDIPNTLGGSEPSAVGQMKDCSRCNQKYIVEDGDLLKDDCKFHDGKAITTKVDGRRSRIMSCCSTQMGSSGCCTGPHVFLEKDAESLNKRAGFIRTPLRSDSLDVVALDCEMSFTTSGMSLTRLTVVNSDAEVILDELIKPHSKIIDANTRFSGVTIKQIEESAVFDLVGIRSVLFEIGVGSDTIIVGHGLENDLNALRIVHSNILDTAILYPHPAGLPFRNSLRNLAADVLKKFIQDAAPSSGTVVATHSSLEDASTTLDLLRSFMNKN